MKINALRTVLYSVASLLGWLNAILRGKIVGRIFNVAAYRGFSSIFRRLK